MNKKPKVLFILKHRESTWNGDESYTNYSSGQISSGLSNSATFVVDALNETDLVERKFIQQHLFIKLLWPKLL